MIEACALYFPLKKLPLTSVFPNGRSDGGLLRPPTWFEYEAVKVEVKRIDPKMLHVDSLDEIN